MKCIFLDESGDLGFSEKSSKFLTITLLVCDIKKEAEIRRVVKKIRQKFLKKKLKNSPEVKWNNSSEYLKIKILKSLAKKEFEVLSIILDKKNVYSRLKKEKHKLYNYLCKLILSECSLNDSAVELFVDRSKGKRALRDDFDNYIRSYIVDENCNLKIKHEDSKGNGGLQSLDFVSGAIFNKYKYGNEKFYDIIKDKIFLERKLFSHPDPGD